MVEGPQSTTRSGDRTPKRIGIAIVEDAGHVLVGVRQANRVLAGQAEFPGGKCEPDESPGDCAIRECLEETGLAVEPVEQLDRLEYEYPHATVDLHFWLCRPVEGLANESPQNGFRWRPVGLLGDLNFPSANTTEIEKLIQRYRSGS